MIKSAAITAESEEIMNSKFKQTAKRLLSGFIATATAVTMLPEIPAMAENFGCYPYTLFAGSSAEGAITTTASNFGVNGNVATNGTISATGNMNINGTKTENAGFDMIYIFDKIDTKYFSGNNVEEHTEDYVLDELNINIITPTEVLGEAELTGNININTALKAFEDVTLNGEVNNTNDSVIFSKYGDIVIDSTNVNLNGLVYAPFGSVEVKAMNLNLNNVVIIADSIVLDCPNVNANYSTNAADFVGTVSEPLNIPKDEWQYMKDENENGLPDFFENFDNWSKLADTDGDGLPDSVEEYLGSDPDNTDTDGDGLNDYYEVFGTYTDPTKADSDENGVNDGDEDFDEDGLTNLEEFLNNTYPYIDDSDNDGLSDGDEVNKYGTDPLVADTDGDGLDDGDEIILGTNPLVQDTDGDGIIDSKEKFQQTFTHKVKNDDCAVTEVIVDMECTGNINKTTSVESVMNTDILCTDVVGLVGEPFEIETNSEFDKATLMFKVDKNKLGNVEFENLLFLWYNEEENEFIELETILDEVNSTASITTTHFSKYMVVDKRAWFEAWAVELDYNPTGGAPGAPSIPVKYNTVLAIDCSGSMDWNDHISVKSGINSAYDAQYPYTCNRITAAEGFIRYMHPIDETAIVFFTSSTTVAAKMTNDKETLKLALQGMKDNGGTSFSAAINASIAQIDSAEKISNGANKNRIILLSDGDDGDSASKRNVAVQKCKDKFIEVYTVGFGSANDAILRKIAEETGGEYYRAMDAEEIVDIFAKLGYMDDFDMTDTDGDGLPDAVEVAGIRLQNGKIIYLDPTDYDCDDDGLLDGEEIDPKPFYSEKEDNGLFGLYKLLGINTVQGYYFKMRSDPRFADSDYDGIDDNKDGEPNNNSFSGTMTDQNATWDVNFNVDYREFFIDTPAFSRNLAILGSIYANLAYNDPYLDITSGVSGNYNITQIYDIFGLSDIVDYKLVDYYPDDDISEMIIGHRCVSYMGEKKDIIVVSVRGTDSTIEEWSSNFDVGADTDAYWDRDNPHWRNEENHKGFDVAANRLFDLIGEYVKSHIASNMQKAIYIVGHSRGAAIANILGAEFENDHSYDSFTYTFATPNTTTNTNFIEYNTIFNFVNKDDLVPYLPLKHWNFNKYGTTYQTSIKDSYEKDWEKAIDPSSKTLGCIIDYNYNGHLHDTINAFEGIAACRDDLYCYSDDAIYVYSDEKYFTHEEISNAMSEQLEKYGDRISKYCMVSYESAGYYPIKGTLQPEVEGYYVAVKQTPAFLMMNLANFTASKCHTENSYGQDEIVERSDTGIDECEIKFLHLFTIKKGFNVASKYKPALEKYCKSGADTLLSAINFGGTIHAHMPATYYFISSNYNPL